jgi:hypothetical protein
MNKAMLVAFVSAATLVSLAACKARSGGGDDDDDDDKSFGGFTVTGGGAGIGGAGGFINSGGFGNSGGLPNSGGAGNLGGGPDGCMGCGEWLGDDTGAPLCFESEDIVDALYTCFCSECAAECSDADICGGVRFLGDECATCATDASTAGCTGEWNDCANDLGS